jgi:hypothetical protein
MWGVTGWAIATWLRVTVLLGLGVGAVWLWCSPGWFAFCVVVAVLAEIWLLRQLAREWSYQASASWWWTR